MRFAATPDSRLQTPLTSPPHHLEQDTACTPHSPPPRQKYNIPLNCHILIYVRCPNLLYKVQKNSEEEYNPQEVSAISHASVGRKKGSPITSPMYVHDMYLRLDLSIASLLDLHFRLLLCRCVTKLHSSRNRPVLVDNEDRGAKTYVVA